ncbi:MAG: SseB family protein [Ectothiorhodospiraceae bacterium]|nr:SseB family protein [Ectothiorhodospiraceae bacterium]
MTATDHNRLETLLRLSRRDPGHRPAFYRVLLESRVYVIGSGPDTAEGGEQRVALQQWETPDGQAVIPFFTSLEVLRESIEEDEHVLGLSGRELFGLARNMSLYLNPRSEDGEPFSPDEVSNLLSGDLPREPGRPGELETADPELELLRMDALPAEAVSALTTLFAGLSGVRRAWLLRARGRGKDGAMVLALDCDPGCYGPAEREAAFVLGQLEKGWQDCRFLHLDGRNLQRLVSDAPAPFYDRRWGQLLDTSLEPGRA